MEDSKKEFLMTLRAELEQAIEMIDNELADESPTPPIRILYPLDKEYRISQKFGENPAFYKKYGYSGHFGIDIAAYHGSAILAVAPGKVTREGHSSGNGNYIEITHEWGKSLYLHMKDRSMYRVGDKVEGRTIIGFVGNTGTVSPAPTPQKPLAGTHLHFSMTINGQEVPGYKGFIDPLPYLEAAEIIQ